MVGKNGNIFSNLVKWNYFQNCYNPRKITKTLILIVNASNKQYRIENDIGHKENVKKKAERRTQVNENEKSTSLLSYAENYIPFI